MFPVFIPIPTKGASVPSSPTRIIAGVVYKCTECGSQETEPWPIQRGVQLLDKPIQEHVCSRCKEVEDG